MGDFQGRVAIITGGGGGIGGCIATALAGEGARVAVADIDIVRARNVAEHIGEAAMAVHLDVTDPAQWQAARTSTEAAFGPVDIICSNAGVGYSSPVIEIPINAWRWVYEVNVLGALHALQTFLPGMKARGTGGHILLTCSISALYPFATQAAYTSSKAALLNLASGLHAELAGTGIGVCALCPGAVATDLLSNAQAALPTDLKETDADPMVNQRLAQGMAPEAVANAAIAAMRDNRFFAFTHPDYLPAISQDFAHILDAMKVPADPFFREAGAMVTPILR